MCSDNQNFEVVISDNASNDNTQELLSQINDPRLKYFRSEKSIAPTLNWLQALEHGQGEWLYLVMSRDRIHGENIGDLIEILSDVNKDNITYFHDGYIKDKIIHIYKGIDAMMQFVARCHPTGSVFSGKIFRAIPNKLRYFENSDAYPENYLRLGTLLQGNGASIRSGVYYWGEFLIDFTQIKSTFDVSKDTSNLFFAPKRLIRQYSEMIDLLDELNEVFNMQERDKFFRQKFYALLLGVSIGYRVACVYDLHCKHYGFDARHVTLREMLQNIFTAYRQMKEHLMERATYTRRRNFMMCHDVAKLVIYYLPKYLIYSSVRQYAQKILEPLGIWQLLKRVKQKILS